MKKSLEGQRTGKLTGNGTLLGSISAWRGCDRCETKDEKESKEEVLAPKSTFDFDASYQRWSEFLVTVDPSL